MELAVVSGGSSGSSATPPRAAGTTRGRTSSWGSLPQHLRGIRLRELFAICEDNRDWLEENRWRCSRCHVSCSCDVCRRPRTMRRPLARQATDKLLARARDNSPGNHGPCQQEGCGCETGVQQMRNLYEVNEVIIKPRCEASHVSYVELLRLDESGLSSASGDPAGVRVDTFVSHWWGEEFPMMVKTLKKYAKYRCDGHCRRQREFKDWSFWICAFANNQFAVDHATGLDGDVSTSAFAVALQSCGEMVAVIDPGAEIYKRIWCTFELFYADSLPHRPKIALANPAGIFSAGAATRATVRQMRELISTVRVAEASATVEADRIMIMDALAAAGVSTERLDSLLRKQVHEGLRMVCLRAKFFSQVSCHFLCGVVVMVLGGTLARGSAEGFVANYSWYIEWAILLHVPPLSGVCIMGVFLLGLALLSDVGRNRAVDWMWLFTHVGMSRSIHEREGFVKLLGGTVVVASVLTMLVSFFSELRSEETPHKGGLSQGPAFMMCLLAAVLFLESFVLDLRLVPRRFRTRVAAIELLAVCSGMIAGLVILHCESRVVVVLVLVSWLLVFSASFLRDHCTPRVRRRIEEPFWSLPDR